MNVLISIDLVPFRTEFLLSAVCVCVFVSPLFSPVSYFCFALNSFFLIERRGREKKQQRIPETFLSTLCVCLMSRVMEKEKSRDQLKRNSRSIVVLLFASRCLAALFLVQASLSFISFQFSVSFRFILLNL